MNKVSLNARALAKARDEFALSFYLWAKKDAKTQAEQEFPLFALLRDPLVNNYLRAYRTLSPDKSPKFLQAMVKRTHERAVEITGEFISAEERELIEYFVAAPWRYDEEGIELRRKRLRLTARNRDQLGRLIKMHVKQEMQDTFEEWTTTDFAFYKLFSPWRVSTIVSIKSKQNLGYDHTIGVAREPKVVLKERTSITRWLGIGETNWTLMIADDIQQCAKAPIILANHFLAAVPSLLTDIKSVGMLYDT